MALIETRHRRIRANFLPDFPVKASDKWRSRGLVALFDVRNARELISGDRATNITSLAVNSALGRAADFSGTANQQYAHRPAYAITGALSIVAVLDVDALTNYSQIISKEGATTSQMPYELRVGKLPTGSDVILIRANSTQVERWAPSNLFAAPQTGKVLIVTSSAPPIETATLNAYWGGGKTSMSSTFGTATGTPTDGGAAVWIGRRSDGATQLDGRIYYIGLFNRDLTDGEATFLNAHPSDLVEPANDAIWVPVSASGAGYTLTAATTSFAVTGSATGLKADRRLAATSATFGVTGNAAGLKRSYALQATQASYALTGNATALKATRRLTAAAASFALTSNAVTLTYTQSRTLQVTAAGFTLTGNTVAMLAARRLAAAVASYSLTGTAIGLNASRRLSVSAAAYTLSGQTAGLRATRRLSATAGIYTLTGIDVALTKSTARTLTAVAGAYAVTGQAASLRAARRMTAGVASFALSGSAVGLAKGFRLAAANSSFALTGQNVAFRYTRRMAIEPGLFALTGNAVTMTYTGTVIVYARAPAGSGYAPRRDERQSRPRSGNTTRTSNTQRNTR